MELTKNIFHVCVPVSITREIPAKSASYVYLIQIDNPQNFSLACMCIEFVIQVAQAKRMRMYFLLLGW